MRHGTSFSGLAAALLALSACGDGKPGGTGASGAAPAGSPASAAACAAEVHRPLRDDPEAAPCVRAIASPTCREAVARAIAEKASRAQIVPAFLACRRVYCEHKLNSNDLCNDPAPTRAGEARDKLGELLGAAIAADHADVEGKLRGAGLLLEKAIFAPTTVRFALQTEPDVVISGLGDDLRMAQPPTAESLADLVDRLKAREKEPELADVLIDTPKASSKGPMRDILKALSAAGFDHVVICTPTSNCR
jgi:hypothetical protein